MSNQKISQLDAITGSSVDHEDVLAIVNSSTTKKIKYEELLSNAALSQLPNASSTNVGIPSAKINFADDAIGPGVLADNSVATGNIIASNVDASKLADYATAQFKAGAPVTGNPTPDYKGQLCIDTSDSNKVYISVDGSAWAALDAGITAVNGGDSGIVNVVSTTSNNEATITATIDNFDATKFLAGPTTGSAAAPTARVIEGTDIPVATSTVNGGVKITSSTGLKIESGVIKLDATVSSASGSTNHLVQYDAQGLVVAGGVITSADLPAATSSAKGAIIPNSTDFSIDGSGNLALANSLTGAQHPLITYNAKGLVTAGGPLTSANIPDLPASKITSGELASARISSDAITGAKLADNSTCIIYSLSQNNNVYPTKDFDGQLWVDPTTDDVYVYDGNRWVPITSLASGNLNLGGVYNANTSTLTTVTTYGQSVGLTQGQNLPTPTATLDRTYVVVGTAGTPSGIPNGPTNNLVPPDYILSTTSSSGSVWSEIDLSTTVASPTAASVSVASGWGGSATNVQTALAEVESDKLDKAGGIVTGALEIGTAGSLKFEGSAANDYEITIAPTNPTADRTLTLPNQTGNFLISGNAAIVAADISASAAIAYSQLAALADGKVLIGSGSNVPTAQTISGDITISNAGVAAISSGSIIDSDVKSDANIAGSKLAAGSTSAQGALQLSDATNSSSTSLAATANAVKTAYDLANAALPKAGGDMSGNVVLTNAKEVRFNEATSNGSAYIGIKSPDDRGSDTSYTIVLPSASPGTNKVLKSGSSTATDLVWADDTTNVAAGDLTGTTMASNVVTSSLTTVGTVANGTWAATDVAVLHGGTGASSASAARTNLGVAIGSDVQAFDADTAKTDVAQAWTKPQRGNMKDLGSSVSGNLDLTSISSTDEFSNYTNFKGVLSGATTMKNFTIASAMVGQSGMLRFQQDGTGGREISWESKWVFPEGTKTVTTTGNAYNNYVYFVEDTARITVVPLKDVKAS